MNKPDVASERKNQIVRATVDCMTKYGYNNFSMQDVAKSAKVSKGIIHYYFLNKDDLMMSVLEKVASDIEHILQTDMEAIDSPIEKLKIFIEGCFDIVKNTREYYQVNMDFWTQINQKNSVREVIAKHYENFRKTCGEVLQEGIDRKFFHKVNVHEYSSYIIATIDGISLQWLFDNNIFEYDKVAKQMCDWILKGIVISK